MAQSIAASEIGVADGPSKYEAQSPNFTELKTPRNGGGIDRFEGGAIRAVRGSVSIFAWENLGMAAHMAGVGIVYSTVSGVIYSVLNNYLHMSATLVATATALAQFPRSLRLFTGMLTDTTPIFGYHRRPYMLIGWFFAFVSRLLMAVIPLGNLYYGDPTLIKVDLEDLTTDQLALIDTDASQRGVKIIILMMLANFGTVLAYSGFNGVMIEVSQQEPTAIRGTAMGDGMVVFYVCSVFSSFFTGLGLNSVDYGGTFSWTIGFNAIMGICAAAAFITLPFSWFCIQEDKVESGPKQSVFVYLYELLQLRIIYRYVAFRFFYNVLALFSVTALNALQSQWTKVEPVNSGIATMLAAFLTMTGTYGTKRFGLGWNWRYIIIVAQVRVVCIDMIPTVFTIWDVFRNQWFWLGVPLLEKLPFATTDYAGALFMLVKERSLAAGVFAHFRTAFKSKSQTRRPTAHSLATQPQHLRSALAPHSPSVSAMRLFSRTARSVQLLRGVTTHRLLSTDAAPRSFRKILIANRGEIALRVIRSAQKLNIETVAVYSDADANSQHVKQATEAYRLGPAPANESYLNYEKILEICRLSGAEAVHPGYGFLSENAFFARACADANIEFIGPPVKAIEAMGSKSASKDIMIAAGVPVTPGYHGAGQSFETLQAEARKIGYPVLIKAVLGGGGKGMRIVDDEKDLRESLEACQREGKASFGDARVLIEKYLRKPRHVELQVFGDKFGNVVHLFERDCSVQRRHQKVLEEAPAPHMSEALRKKMGDAAVAAAKAVGYVGAGTVEFLLDEDESFYFMEMNTRLQVEHPVTELITKQDLVELQLKVAAGQTLPIKQEDLKIHGHAIEARIYAENPYNNFLPGSGKLQHLRLPPVSDTVRVDTGIIEGDEVSIFYDPMIAKLIVHGKNRQEALDSLIKALHQYQIVGLPTNIEFVARTADHPEFRKGGVDTSFLNKFGDEVLEPLGKFPTHAKALAAVSLLLFEQLESYPLADFNGELNSPWSEDSLKHFRSLETFERKFHLNYEGSQVAVGVKCHASDSYELSLTDENEEPVTVHAKGSISPRGDFEIRVDNRKFKGTAVVHNQDVHIFCDDGTQRYEYKFNVPLPSLEAAEGAGGGSGHSKIVTPMPGKIIKVLVKSGESIKQEQPLLIMEAMKMEHVIRATKDGKVEDVFCEEGDFVTDGHVLIELN